MLCPSRDAAGVRIEEFFRVMGFSFGVGGLCIVPGPQLVLDIAFSSS